MATDTHKPPGRFRRLLASKAGKLTLALIVLNEIRGACVVAGVLVVACHKGGF